MSTSVSSTSSSSLVATQDAQLQTDVERVTDAVTALIGAQAAAKVIGRPGGVLILDSDELRKLKWTRFDGARTQRRKPGGRDRMILPQASELGMWGIGEGGARQSFRSSEEHFAQELLNKVEIGAMGFEEANEVFRTYEGDATRSALLTARFAQGFYIPRDETTVLVADRIEPGKECAVYLHEVVHSQGMKILGPDVFDRLVGQIRAWNSAPRTTLEWRVQAVASRRALASAGADSDHYDEELFAYAVEEAVAAGVRPTLEGREGSAEQWLGDVVATLRGAIFQITQGAAPELDAQQIVDLAYALAQMESPIYGPVIKKHLDAMKPEVASTAETHVQPAFFSQLASAIERAPARLGGAPALQWLQWLHANAPKMAVKAEEIEWTGIADYLDTLHNAKVTHEELGAYLRGAGVRIQDEVLAEEAPYRIEEDSTQSKSYGVLLREQEVARFATESEAVEYVEGQGSEEGDARYATRVVPGGRNYRELLITMSNGRSQEDFKNGRFLDWLKSRYGMTRSDFLNQFEAAAERQKSEYLSEGTRFQSSHWKGIPNVLVHVRLDDRVSADGRRTLFVNEIQSDWGQLGRSEGFAKPTVPLSAAEEREFHELRFTPWADRTQTQHARIKDFVYRSEKPMTPGVMPGPFVGKTEGWVSLAVKRIAMLAVEGGYDRVAFVTGSQAAKMFGLEKVVGHMEYEPIEDPAGTYEVAAFGLDDKEIFREDEISLDRVREVFGKAIADLIEADAGAPMLDRPLRSWRLIDREGIKIGGDGMREFYDAIVPQVASDVVRRLGGTGVDTVTLPSDPDADVSISLYGDGSAAVEWPGGSQEFDSEDAAEAFRDTLSAPTTHRSFEVTPKMRARVQQGVPLFSHASAQPWSELPQWWTQGVAVAAKMDDLEAASADAPFILELDDEDKGKVWRVAHVPLSDIVVSDVAPEPSRLDERLEAIRAADQLDRPILEVAATGGVKILDGWHRLQVAKERGESGISCLVGMDERLANRLGNGLNQEVLYSFAGVTAATMDPWAQETARALLEAGVAVETVRQQTGWFKGPDEKWRFEISDEAAAIKPVCSWKSKAESGALTLGAFVDHPALFAAYPLLERMPITFELMTGARASLFCGEMRLDAGTFKIDDLDGACGIFARHSLLKTVLHEVQHALQAAEGFATGGNWMDAFADPRLRPTASALGLRAAQQLLSDRIEHIGRPLSLETFAKQAWGSDVATDEIAASYRQYRKDAAAAALSPGNLQRAQEWAAKEWYRRLAGEVEARNVSTRLALGPQERIATSPWVTSDVHAADVIVVFSGQEMQDAAMPINWQRCWHGSPYRFDRFDLARARTGEGALAFGWGVYAAKSRGVAENYTGMHGIGGATVPTYFKIKGVLTEPRSPEQKAADLIHGLGLPGARKFARGMLEEARSGEPWTMDRGLDYYEAVARVTLDCEHKRDVERASGYLYEVDVPADGLLLWDAPMCDQPPEVLAALKAQGFGRGTNRAGDWLMHMWSSLGEGKFDEISSLAPGSSQEAMSRWLLSIGVHGIQYLDSASRGAVARGEFNFVFFSDDHVRIHRVTEAAPQRQRVA